MEGEAVYCMKDGHCFKLAEIAAWLELHGEVWDE